MTHVLRRIRQGEVLELRLDRPEVHNALDENLIEALSAAAAEAARDATVRVVLLSGEGKSFCAGADIGYMQRLSSYDHAANLQDAHRLSGAFAALSRCPKPVVAKVHGAAIGGGVGLVAACDIVIASEAARFGLSEVRLGILPAVISPFVLRRIGPGAARPLFLTGDRFTAARALELGLVDQVVAPDQLDAAVEAVIGSLRLGGPLAQASIKRLLDEVAPLAIEEAADITAESIATQRATDEAKEGFAAFFAKRPPRWAGPTSEGSKP
jgi:methylglutaconyl-CoA hydratase